MVTLVGENTILFAYFGTKRVRIGKTRILQESAFDRDKMCYNHKWLNNRSGTSYHIKKEL